MPEVEGTNKAKEWMLWGSASKGHTKPAAKTKGKEEKSTTGVAISLEEKSEPKNNPKAIEAHINATPKVSKSPMFAKRVTSKCEKL